MNALPVYRREAAKIQVVEARGAWLASRGLQAGSPCKPGSAKAGKPNFFIVGAPKCGTSAMAHYLARHPDIYMAKKEMHAFGTDLRFGIQFYRRDLAAYLAEFHAVHAQSVVGEASVWYLFSTSAAAEIQAFNQESKILIMLREPAEALHSLYYQFLYDGNEDLPTFEEALAAEADRRAGRRIPHQTHFAQGLAYRETVRYTEQVRRYFDLFGRNQVQVIIYDDFIADTAAVYRQALDFLGLHANGVGAKFEVVNGNKSVRSAGLRAVLNQRYFRAGMVALARRLPRPMFLALRGVDRSLWKLNTRPVRRPPLRPELRAQLKREFASEIEQLSELLERDLTHWSR